jgi:hypothetical protein
VREFLGGARSRMLFFELVEPEVEVKPARPSPPPNLYRAKFFDYTNNRTIFVDGSLNQPKRVKVSESGFQPLPGRGRLDPTSIEKGILAGVVPRADSLALLPVGLLRASGGRIARGCAGSKTHAAARAFVSSPLALCSLLSLIHDLRLTSK